MKGLSGGNRDALVVSTAQLAEVMRLWLSKHNGRFPTDAAQNENHFVTGYQYIIMHSYSVNERAIYRILSGESKVTNLRIADEILTAIDEISAFHDGRVPIMPNPGWSTERWLAWKAEQGCI
jgi:hypothetical protein